MAESSSHNTSLLEITPKEEPITLDKPESPNPFLPVPQVEFTFEEIAFTTNNEVALLYPSHPNQEYFKDVLDFTSKCCLKEAFTRALTQYKEYLCGKTGGLDQISNKDATILFISLLLEHMMPEYDNEELTINPTQVFSVHNWTLKPNQPEEPPFTTYMKAICKLDVLVVSKAPKPTSQTEEGPPVKKEPTLSSVVDMDEGIKNYSFDYIFLGSNPNVLVDKTKYVGDGLKTTHTDLGTNEESRADDTSKKIKVEHLSEFLKDTRYAFFTSDSPQDKPIIATDKIEEEDDDKEETDDTSHDMPKDTSVSPPPSLKLAQIQELMAHVQLLKFATVVENALKATTKDVPSAGQATASPTKGEKNTKDAKTKLKDELINLLSTNVVTQYYNKKLLFDKYCDKMLKRKKSPKITNCEVLTKKGPITLNIYREDGSE
ncbi:hypothetical protein Tco_0680360 [Tanacetum coccineum]|uniref:Uncharacterized protein n=1 Tax=Tanacetum coccineum TaxID=301880 RepID=A0ABQ4XL94_9ASTR